MIDRDDSERHVAALGQHIRVKVRPGTGVPLVLCNGIGASLEMLDPLVAQLDPDTTVVRFDAPGVGGSSDSPVPYGFPYLAAVLGRLLRQIELTGPVDVLGYSWGGALAQQFAFQNPRRCRRLILTFTATGAIMLPAWAVACCASRQQREGMPVRLHSGRTCYMRLRFAQHPTRHHRRRS
jgi:pimeloyl-ACP methyl ester carboxylesterase